MDPYGPLVFAALLALCVVGFHAGILAGVRFLRKRQLIDTRAIQFIADTLFGKLGTNYKLFYDAYAEAYGRNRALFVLGVHFACLLGFLVLPFLAEEFFLK